MCEHCYKRKGEEMCVALALHNQDVDIVKFRYAGWLVTAERVKKKRARK